MRKMRRIAGAVLLCTVLLLLITGCEKTSEKANIRIGSMPTQTAAIYAIGTEKGFFKKNDLDVTLTIFPSAVERDTAATAGTVDGFLTDVMGLVNLREHGFDFYATSGEYENFSLVTGAGYKFGMNEAKKALKVGISNNTVTEYLVDTWPLDVKIEKVSIPKVPERVAALISGSVEAAVFPEPVGSMMVKKGGTVLASSEEAGIQPVVFIFSGDYLKKNPENVQRFYKAYSETVQYLKTADIKEYQDILVKWKLVSKEQLGTYRLPVDKYGEPKIVSEKDVVGILNWMKNKGMLKKTYEYKDLTEDRFIKKQ